LGPANTLCLQHSSQLCLKHFPITACNSFDAGGGARVACEPLCTAPATLLTAWIAQAHEPASTEAPRAPPPGSRPAARAPDLVQDVDKAHVPLPEHVREQHLRISDR